MTPKDLVVFAIFLGALVTVHELGHFVAAKWAGVKVLKFSIGFGPRVFGFRRGETEYQVAWVPLGGFVKMHGDYPGEEHDYDDPERHRGLYAAPWWKRAIIMSAGPAFNLIFPVFAYFVAFLGDMSFLSPRVGMVAADMPAGIAGIRPGDVITKVNGVEIVRFDEISEAIGDAQSPIPVTVKRGAEELTFQLNPVITIDESNPIESTKKGMLGIGAGSPAPVIGVPVGSVAEQAGLKTFDRVLSINGEPTPDEVSFARVLAGKQGTLQVQVARLDERDVAGLPYAVNTIASLSVERQPGDGYAALGAEPGELYVSTVLPGSAAAKLGLVRGDRLVSLNDVEVRSFFLFDAKLRALEDRPFTLAWRHGGETKKGQSQRQRELSYDEFKNERRDLVFGTGGFVGSITRAVPGEIVTVSVGPQQALTLALKQVPKAIKLIGSVLMKLVTGGVPLDAWGGPLAVYQVATKSAEAGLDVYLMNMAIVSVNLGLVNLLPIPIFDGFALLAALWEGIRRRPIPLKFREYANMFGLAVIAMLVVLAFKNDITKMFR